MNKQDRYNFLVEESRKLYPDTPDFLIQLACQQEVKEEFEDETIELKEEI